MHPKELKLRVSLCMKFFGNLFKKYVVYIRTRIETRKQAPDIRSIISKNKNITKGLHQCLATGNWNVQKDASYVKTGVSQVLDRMTFVSVISHLRRIVIPSSKSEKDSGTKHTKNIDIRQIHASQYGFICPCEVPEGQKAGLVMNLALTATVTKGYPSVLVRETVEEYSQLISVSEIKLEKIREYTGVYINGMIVGYVIEPYTLTEKLKELRHKNVLNREVSISYDIIDNDIRIYSDSGRFIRPLLTVKNGKKLRFHKYLSKHGDKKKFKWNSLIKSGIIEYVDVRRDRTLCDRR